MIKIPSTDSSGLISRFVFRIDDIKSLVPEDERYSLWVGMITLFAEAKALSVNVPNEGLQSINI